MAKIYIVYFDVFRLAYPKSRFFSITINFLTKINDVIWNRHVISHLLISLKFDFEPFLFPRDLGVGETRNGYFENFAQSQPKPDILYEM